jgi:putative ABC transport system permease protein
VRRFVGEQLRHRPGRGLALAIGLAVAAAGAVLLAATAKTGDARVHGAITRNFRSAYQILVRPESSLTPLEREQGLVRPNYLSGIYGGITFRQYDEIKRIPGVEVAAPVANVGVIFPQVSFRIRLDRWLTRNRRTLARDPVQLFRIKLTFVAHNGRSHYPEWTGYVYYTRNLVLNYAKEVVPGRASAADVCGHFSTHTSYAMIPSPFYVPNRGAAAIYECLSAAPGSNYDPLAIRRGFRGRGPTWRVYFPVLLAAIDPVQEARLLHLDRTVVAGRYLRPTDGAFRDTCRICTGHRLLLPVLASSRLYIDERLDATVERLATPPPAELRSTLARASDAQGRRFLRSLRGRVVGRMEYPFRRLYERLFDRRLWLSGLGIYFDAYWHTSPVRYRRLGRDELAPVAVRNPWSVWWSRGSPQQMPYRQMPLDDADVQFRQLQERTGNPIFRDNGVNGTPNLLPVGRYDPEKLPTYSPLSRVPLETYYPPLVRAADTRSRRALGGKPLLPTQNVGDYIQQPPLVLMSLRSLREFLKPGHWLPPFADPKRYSTDALGGRAKLPPNPWAKAPISTIRIRVASVHGPDRTSIGRIEAVAALIHERTGLHVDVTAGSSPHPITIRLPPGRFGRPALLLREGWSKKGASVAYLRAIDRKTGALIGLVLLVGGFFAANAVLAALRTRRAEIGILRCVGWRRKSIFAAVLAEVAVVALAAGVGAAALSLGVAAALGIRLPLWEAVAAIPLALGLALVAASIPAARAAAVWPVEALLPPVRSTATAHAVRRHAVLPLVNLTRLPGRAAIAAGALAAGCGALTVLWAIERSFSGAVVGTLLGSAVLIRVHTADLVGAGVLVALAALALAEVLFVSVRERAPEFATLRAFGWRERAIATVVALEAVYLGLAGATVGAAAGVLIGLALGVPLASLALTGLATVAGGLTAALAASVLPVTWLRRDPPAAALSTDA